VLLALSEMLPNMRGSCSRPPRCCQVSLGRRDIKTEIEIFPNAGQVINVSTAIHALDVGLTRPPVVVESYESAISPSSAQSIGEYFVLEPSRGAKQAAL
jgi:hypothetical protein